MKFIKDKDIDKNKWTDLLLKSNFSSPFQTIEFFNLYNELENLAAEVFSIEENSEYVALVVVTIQKERGLKSFFTKRGIIYGGIVLRSENSIYLNELLKGINSYYKNKVIYIEVRNNFEYKPYKEIFKNNNWIYSEHLNVQLGLENTDIDSLLSNMKYNRRREIKISFKEKAIIKIADSEEEVIILYNILKDMYKERVKLPLFDLSFFINLFKSRIGKIFLVLHEDKIIGGSFCIYYDKMTINTLYYTGLRNYHKKIFPTHLAVYGALEFALNNDLKMLDFMGAGKPNIKYGVRDYKLKFGGELVEQGRFVKILNPFLYKLGLLGVKLIKKIS